MKNYICCGQVMKVRPIVDDEGLLFSYECDICNDGFCRDPGEPVKDVFEILMD